MNQGNQGNNPPGSAGVPMKRKRGRPRKYPKPYYEETVHTPNNHNLNLERNAGFSSGFEKLNGSRPHQAASVNNDAHIEVGHTVIGVVDAPFDAGYLITVRAANSGTLLKGVVFMTGLYVPVTAENDIAPYVPMIRRNEVPMPFENYTQAHGLNPHSRERNDKQQTSRRNEIHSSNGSKKANNVPGHCANHVTSKGKLLPSVAASTTAPLMSRGKVVPVILQPANLSNLSPLGNEAPLSVQTSHVTRSRRRVVQATVNSSNGVGSTSQVTAAVNQAISQSQTRQVSMSEGVQGGIHRHTQVATDMLASDVKRIHAPIELVQTQILDARSAGKIATENNDHIVKDEPLVIEALQTLQPYKVNDHCACAPKPVDDRTEKSA